jgi:hypothetical protein
MSVEDKLMELIKARKHPNCTLYLIWHYVRNNQMEYAQSEFVRDSDKLSGIRSEVADLLGLTNQ